MAPEVVCALASGPGDNLLAGAGGQNGDAPSLGEGGHESFDLLPIASFQDHVKRMLPVGHGCGVDGDAVGAGAFFGEALHQVHGLVRVPRRASLWTMAVGYYKKSHGASFLPGNCVF
jgi:hypothetical protein